MSNTTPQTGPGLPYLPPPPQPAASRSLIHGTGWLVAGAILIAARVILPAIPDLFVKVSLNQAQGICSSGFGVLAQGLNHTVATRCGEVSAGMTVLNVIAFAGAALGAAGFYKLYRAGRHTS